MARLLLLRHGESAWNAEGRWQGWADPPLSPLGEAQSAAAVAWLEGLQLDCREPFSGAISSDLERARRTATILAEGLGLGAVEEDSRLRERDVGEWSSLTAEQIRARWPDALEGWRAGRLHQPPGGESDDMMAARVLPSLGRLAARPGGPLVVVTHGGVIRLLDRRLGREPLRHSNLCGRWLEPVGDSLLPGEVVMLPDLPDPDDAATAAIR